MASKTIINEIDVSNCEYLNPLDNGVKACIAGERQVLKYNVCECNHNCYFKQLKRKEQEYEDYKIANAELEKENDELLKFKEIQEKELLKLRGQLQAKEQECEELKTKIKELLHDCNSCKIHQYKQALIEIEDYVRDNCDFDKSDKLISDTGAYDILEMIPYDIKQRTVNNG